MIEPHPSFGYTTEEEIKDQMLTEWPEFKSAAKFYQSCPSTLAVSTHEVGISDYSFSRQIRQLVEEPSTLHPDLNIGPDAFVVTARSAVPVSSSIKAYYEALGRLSPPITHIAADRNASRGYYLKETVSQDEVNRLRRFLHGARHVSIVDQFVQSEMTIRYGAALLHKADVPLVSGIRGQWYAQINPNHVSVDTLDSNVSDLMKAIGQSAAEAVLASV